MTSPPPSPPPNRGLPLGSARASSSNPPSQGLSLGRGRGRGRGSSSSSSRGGRDSAANSSTPSSSSSSLLIQDQATRSTDSDALISRLSATNAGYIERDPFSGLFSHPEPTSTPTSASTSIGHSNAIISHRNHKRPPLINIGTYLRSRTLDEIVGAFLAGTDGAEQGKKQIVSLGAGSDSRFWRLNASNLSSRLNHYLEIDFPQLTSRKIISIIKTDLLRNSLIDESLAGDIEDQIRVENNDSLVSSKYSLVPCDLRSFQFSAGDEVLPGSDSSLPNTHSETRPTSTPSASTSALPTSTPTTSVPSSLLSSLDPKLPTMILCECVLAYLPPTEGDSVLKYFSDHFQNLKLVCYDMCIAGDKDDGQGSNGAGKRNGDTIALGGSSLRSLMDDDAALDVGVAQASRFGKVMLQNLESRNLHLPGARHYSTVSSNSNRFDRILKSKATRNSQDNQGSQVQADDARQTIPEVKSGFKTLERIWRELDGAERDRLSRIEHLDEVEELEMLLRHYAISWSERNSGKRERG